MGDVLDLRRPSVRVWNGADAHMREINQTLLIFTRDESLAHSAEGVRTIFRKEASPKTGTQMEVALDVYARLDTIYNDGVEEYSVHISEECAMTFRASNALEDDGWNVEWYLDEKA